MRAPPSKVQCYIANGGCFIRTRSESATQLTRAMFWRMSREGQRERSLIRLDRDKEARLPISVRTGCALVCSFRSVASRPTRRVPSAKSDCEHSTAHLFTRDRSFHSFSGFELKQGCARTGAGAVGARVRTVACNHDRSSSLRFSRARSSAAARASARLGSSETLPVRRAAHSLVMPLETVIR